MPGGVLSISANALFMGHLPCKMDNRHRLTMRSHGGLVGCERGCDSGRLGLYLNSQRGNPSTLAKNGRCGDIVPRDVHGRTSIDVRFTRDVGGNVGIRDVDEVLSRA